MIGVNKNCWLIRELKYRSEIEVHPAANLVVFKSSQSAYHFYMPLDCWWFAWSDTGAAPCFKVLAAFEMSQSSNCHVGNIRRWMLSSHRSCAHHGLAYIIQSLQRLPSFVYLEDILRARVFPIRWIYSTNFITRKSSTQVKLHLSTVRSLGLCG